MQQNAKELSASRALLHPLKIAVIMLRFGASFEDKIAYVPFVFLCRIDILRSTHHGNCALLE